MITHGTRSVKKLRRGISREEKRSARNCHCREPQILQIRADYGRVSPAGLSREIWKLDTSRRSRPIRCIGPMRPTTPPVRTPKSEGDTRNGHGEVPSGSLEAWRFGSLETALFVARLPRVLFSVLCSPFSGVTLATPCVFVGKVCLQVSFVSFASLWAFVDAAQQTKPPSLQTSKLPLPHLTTAGGMGYYTSVFWRTCSHTN